MARKRDMVLKKWEIKGWDRLHKCQNGSIWRK